MDAIKNQGSDPLVAAYKSKGVSGFAKVIFGGSSDKHVHIEAVKKSFFKKIRPDATHKRAELEEALDIFADQEIEALVFGQFTLPARLIPRSGIVQRTMFRTKQEHLEIQLSDARFEIRGAPIKTISWHLADSEGNIEVIIEGFVKTRINPLSLVEQYHLLESGFKLFVLGGRPDDPD